MKYCSYCGYHASIQHSVPECPQREYDRALRQVDDVTWEMECEWMGRCTQCGVYTATHFNKSGLDYCDNCCAMDKADHDRDFDR